MNKIFLCISCFLLAGCVSQITVSYQCDPIGAKLVDDKTGTIYDCPTQLAYQVPPNQQSIVVDGLTAIWISGAKTHLPQYTLYTAQGPQQQLSHPISRDPTAPGMAEDEQYALELQEVEIQQTKIAVDANEEAANRQAFSNAVSVFAQAITNKR